MSFKENYLSKIALLCTTLGKGWKINHLDKRDYLISIFNTEIKQFSIQISVSNNRLQLASYITSDICRYDSFKCTLSLDSDCKRIASHLNRKVIEPAILVHNKMIKDKIDFQEKENEKRVFINLIKSMAQSSYVSCYGFLNLSLENSISLSYKELGCYHSVKFDNLSKENTIKLIAFAKSLQGSS